MCVLRVVLLLLSYSTVGLASQPMGKILGKVIDKTTKQPLVGVNMVLLGTLLGAATDEEGYYRIESVPIGIYQLEASMIGYIPVVRSDVVVNSGRSTNISFELEPTVIGLPGITVTPDHFSKPDYSSVSSRSLDFEEMRKTPGPPDMFRRLQNMPGVLGANDYSPQLIVRGGSPDENLTLLDNIEIYSPFHFAGLGGSGGGMSIVEPKLLERTDFSTGGFGAEYGDKLSSVTNLYLKRARMDELAFDSYINMAGAGLFWKGPIGKKSSYLVATRRGIWDFFMKMAGKDYHPRTVDLHSKFTFNPGVNHKLTLIGVYSQDTYHGTEREFQVGEAVEEEMYEKSANDCSALGINWRWLYSQNGYFEFTPWINSNAWMWNTGPLDNKDKEGFDARETYYGMKTKITHFLTKRFELISGGSFRLIDPEYLQWKRADTLRTGEIFPGYRMEFHPEAAYKISGFLQSSLRFIRGVRLIPGIRYDYFDFTEESCLSPRISLTIDLLTSTKLNAAYGFYYQFPQYYKISLDTANWKLKASRAIHYVVGIEHLFTPDFQLSVEGYYKDLDRLLISEDEESRVFFDTGKGYSKGIEVSVLKKMSKNLFLSGSYTLSKAKRKDKADASEYDFDYDSPHMFNLIAAYRLSNVWQFSVISRYFSGLPYTPYDLSTRYQDESGRWYCKKGSKNSARYPDYHRVDIRIDKRFIFRKWTLNIYLDVWNVYNHENVVGYRYSDDFTEKTPLSMFTLMPMVGIAAEF